jgi:tetratricopeptide (TPR) repeat protein
VLDLTFLGRLYVERGRLTGDVGSFLQADEALRRSLRIYPADLEARTLHAGVRYTMHDFRGALRIAGEILREDATQLGALAVSGDALLELGRYGEARDAYERVAADVPGLPAVDARLARLAFLRGAVGEAERLARRADATAVEDQLDGAGLAWYRALRGQIAFDRGAYRASARLYRSAVRLAPDYPLALAGLGRALAATGRTAEAVAAYERAVDLLPQPEYAAALGDLYALSGRGEDAAARYATVEAAGTLFRAARVYDRALALYEADHDLRHADALRLTAAELRIRGDVGAWDARAWALYRAGRLEEARAASDRALRLGTPSAPFLYHAGMISAALGERDRATRELAEALSIGPAFDPMQAPVARRTLVSLREGT